MCNTRLDLCVLLRRFGPAGDPRGAGIGTKEAIQLVWSCHREIIHDVGPVPEGWTTPPSS
jgi:1-pyrroline-5-carboxylate dehydrogenase